MSSVDFRAYCQAESEEQARLIRLYQGLEGDGPLPAEHYTIGHLADLLGGALTGGQLTLYAREYGDIRASMRAVAMSQLKRQDFYTDASHTAKRFQSYLEASLSLHQNMGVALMRPLSEDAQQDFLSRDEDYQNQKNAVVDTVKATTGFDGPEAPKTKDVVRSAVAKDTSVNSRGVSTISTES